MFYALNWSLVAALLALWSLVAWALHAAAIWTVTNAGKLSGGDSEVSVIRLPEAIAAWVPPEIVQTVNALIESLGPVIDRLLQAAPVLAGGLTVAAWVIWGLGSVLLVVLGAGKHGAHADSPKSLRDPSAPSSTARPSGRMRMSSRWT